MITLLSYKNGEMIIPLESAAQQFYRDDLSLLQDAQALLAGEVGELRETCLTHTGRDPVDHWTTRIKSVESARRKLARLGLDETGQAAVEHLNDSLGLRVVCTFIDDVYLVRKWLLSCPTLQVLEERDYIKSPKENGYRSCHLICSLSLHGAAVRAEIQLRTLAMDCWASLEHQLKYKNEAIVQKLITRELKRCADEIASTDWNLLSIREMVESGGFPGGREGGSHADTVG